MNSIINYALQVALIQAALCLVYVLLYQRHTFYQMRRFYLLGSVLLSVALPIIISLVQFPEEIIHTVVLDPITVTAERGAILTGILEEQVDWIRVFYMFGAATLSVVLLCNLFRLYNMIEHTDKIKEGSNYYCIHDRYSMPSSFFRYIFLNQDHYTRRKEIQSIIDHEKEHIRQYHSLDLLFINLIRIVFWFNPLIWWIRTELKRIHEYQADRNTTELNSVTVSDYCTELYNALFDVQRPLVHSFSTPNLKNRIMKLKQKKSNVQQKWTYLFVLPLLLLTGVLIQSCQETSSDDLLQNEKRTEQIVPTQADQKESSDEVFKVVEQMPRFPGCEENTTDEARKDCAFKKLLEHVYQNIKYPAEARTDGIEGTTVIQFVVSKEGRIKDEKIVRKLGAGCDEEALRVVRKMREDNIIWIPGYQQGKAVSVQYNLPVKFKLE